MESDSSLKSLHQLRQCLITKNWVVIAPERLEGRPLQSKLNPLLDELQSDVENCPFCQHSKVIESKLEKYPTDSTNDTWIACCVENKYKNFYGIDPPYYETH